MSTRSSASTSRRRSPDARRLTARDLNRATLARQLLLERSSLTPLAAIEQLAGMQAQVPRPPFLGLWTRLRTFARDDLTSLIASKQVVRATMMRATIHLVSTADYVRLRPALQTTLVALAGNLLRDRIAGVDLAPVIRTMKRLLPATFDEVRAGLAEAFPDHDTRALAYGLRCKLPLVLVPNDSRWSYAGNADFADAEKFLATRIAASAAADDLVLRYLAAFGPATVKDAARWSAMRDLVPVFERLRPQLVTFTDDRGRELFDLPDAPRPGPDVAAPVRLIPDYDNLGLAYDDRSRLVDDAHRGALCSKNGIIYPTFLVDGRVAGLWSLERTKTRATLTLRPFGKLPKPARTALIEEAERLLRFVEDDAPAFSVAVAA